MSELAKNEIQGDHSNFKGSHYHLIYVLWRLLKHPTQRVSFYRGNDLTATTTPPPLIDEEDEQSTAYASVGEDERDIWCQLKNTKAHWTVGKVLEGNLLLNFIGNTFTSEAMQRKWEIKLVSPAEFCCNDLKTFGEKHSTLSDANGGKNAARLNNIIDEALQEFGPSSSLAKTRFEIEQRAVEIIQQLAKHESFMSRVMELEVEQELLKVIGDSSLASQTKRQLLGSLLDDITVGPTAARWYDIDWFRMTAGFDPTSQKPLDRSVTHACNAQVQSQIPRRFRHEFMAARGEIDAALTEFMTSSKSCFLVTGRSGTGKSWSLYHWASEALRDRARLVLNGQEQRIDSSLTSLIAGVLRPLTAQASLADATLAEKLFMPASQASGFGPLVLIIDDIQPIAAEIQQLRRDINRLVVECEQRRIKVVLSCQTEREAGLKPFLLLKPDLLFHLGETTQRVNSVERCSPFAMSDFLDRELEDAVTRRLSSERHSLQLRAPIFHSIRNPYVLDQLVQSGREPSNFHSIADAEEFVDDLFHERLLTVRRQLSIHCEIDESSAEDAFEALLKSLWEQRHQGAKRPQTQSCVENAVPSFGKAVIDTLIGIGFLTVGQSLGIAEPQLAARAFAERLHRCEAVDQVVEEFILETDRDVLTEWLRLQESPARIATQLVDRAAAWKPAVAHALSRCRVDEAIVVAALIGLARGKEHAPEWDVCDAFGNYALRSRVAWKWLVRLFLSPNDGDRTIAERAFWHLAAFTPERVGRAVRFRLSRQSIRGLSRKDYRSARRRIALAMRPLRNIDSQFAAKTLEAVLSTVAKIAVPDTDETSDGRFIEMQNDPLREEFDELHAVAAFHAKNQLFQQISNGLHSEDDLVRLRSSTGIAALGHDASEVVGPLLAEAIRQERIAPIAANMIWHIGRFAKSHPEVACQAVVQCPANNGDHYEVAGAAISLIEWCGRKHARSVGPYIFDVVLPKDREAKCWLMEILLVTLQPFLADHPRHIEYRARLIDSLENDPHDDPVFRMLRHRALAVARLLEIASAASVASVPDIRRAELRAGWGNFFCLDLGSWVIENMDRVTGHSALPEIATRLIQSILASHDAQRRESGDWHKNAEFMLANESIEGLVACIRSVPTEVQIEWLKQLPDDWERLRALRLLLGQGVRSPEVIELAVAECDRRRNQAMPQAVSERADCLIELRKIAPDRVPEIKNERHGLAWFFGGARFAAEQLAHELDERPQEMLDVLDRVLQVPADLIMTLDWVHKAQRCQTVALSWAFARCADPKTISRREADDLLDLVLKLLEGLPESETTKSWMRLYRSIRQREPVPIAAVPAASSDSTAIQQSHALAAEIMNLSSLNLSRIAWLAADKRGWWESNNDKRDVDGALHHGSGGGFHLCGFFPAVRLALAVRSSTSAWNDPAASWMRDRTRCSLYIKDLRWSRRSDAEKIEQLQGMALEMPQQEELRVVLGNLLVRNGRYDEGLDVLLTVLQMPHADHETRASALYDIACIHARKGDEVACRKSLTESASHRTPGKEHLAADPDFESMRDREWFLAILK